jgi:hypothetical protein
MKSLIPAHDRPIIFGAIALCAFFFTFVYERAAKRRRERRSGVAPGVGSKHPNNIRWLAGMLILWSGLCLIAAVLLFTDSQLVSGFIFVAVATLLATCYYILRSRNKG